MWKSNLTTQWVKYKYINEYKCLNESCDQVMEHQVVYSIKNLFEQQKKFTIEI